MKTVKIFLASSDELQREREAFADLVEHLNWIFRPKGTELQLVKWEYLDASMGAVRKQDEYNRELAGCELALVLYWRRFGRFTEEELRTAHERLKEGRNPKKIYVFFKEADGDGDVSDDLRAFKGAFETKFGHFYCRFENVDTLKLNFLLQFDAYFFETETDGPKLTVTGSRILAGREPVVDLANVPFTANNPEYRRLTDEIRRLEKSVAALETAADAAPAVASVLEEQRRQLAEARRRLDEHERFLFDTALSFARKSGERISARLRKAKDLFESGKAAEANAILDLGEIETDLESNLRDFEIRRDNALLGVEELCMKAKTTMSDDALDVSERVSKACDCYRRAADALRRVGAFPERLADILLEHGRFLADRHRNESAVPLLEESVRVFRSIPGNYGLAQARALNALGDCLFNLGILGKADCAYRESRSVLSKTDGNGPDHAAALGGACFGRANVMKKIGLGKLARVEFRKAEQLLACASDSLSKRRLASIAVDCEMGEAGEVKAVELLEKAADAGDIIAQFQLGVAYRFGRGVGRNDEKAFEWWLKAAEQGEAGAQFNLGNVYHFGEGVEHNDAKAVSWWRQAAEQGLAQAQFNLGRAFHFGEGVERNDEIAVSWWLRAARQGHVAAMFNLGNAYRFGEGLENNCAESMAWWLKAAERGNADAQFNLGLAYDYGDGVERSSGKAVAWYRKAAEQGFDKAQVCLGMAYHYGEGVDFDDVEAVAWFRKAAGQGNAEAQFRLGNAYDFGTGVERDEAEAVAWYRKAAEQGHAYACNALAWILFERGRSEEALPFAERAVAAFRGDGSNDDAIMVLDTLAAVLDALERSDEVKVVCEEELALFPDGSGSEHRETALVRLGRACRRLGDGTGAKDAFRQALEIVEARGGKSAEYGMTAEELRAELEKSEP